MKYNVLTFEKWLSLSEASFEEFRTHVWKLVTKNIPYSEKEINLISRSYGFLPDDFLNIVQQIKLKKDGED